MKSKRITQRILLIALISSVSLSVCYSQAAILVLIFGDKVASEKFHLSLDGALNISSITSLEKGKTNIGINFGLGTHIKLSDKLYLKPEFKPLSQKGAKKVNIIASIPEDITPDETKLKLNYIEVPILLQYYISSKLYISTGPQISFLTTASQFTTGTLNGGSDITFDLDTKSLFNNIDFSFPLELGYSVSFSTKKSTSKVDLNLFARYSYGFIDIFSNPVVVSSHNSTFQIGASFPFIKTPEEIAKSKKE